jgi:hypothetical protein
MTSARLMSRCTVALLIFQRRSLPIRSDYAAQPVDVAVMGIFLPLTGCTQEGTRLSFLRILYSMLRRLDLQNLTTQSSASAQQARSDFDFASRLLNPASRWDIRGDPLDT